LVATVLKLASVSTVRAYLREFGDNQVTLVGLVAIEGTISLMIVSGPLSEIRLLSASAFFMSATAIIGRTVADGGREHCGCFGRWGRPADRGTIGAYLALAGVALLSALPDRQLGVTGWLLALEAVAATLLVRMFMPPLWDRGQSQA